MDTPEKTKISTPLSKFEESPVFSYINSLSPIKPVKSVHATQAFHSLSFSSIPSIFSSPHASTHKESRFSKSIKVPDAVVRSELSSENGKKGNKGIGEYVAELCENSTELQEDLDSGAAAGEDFKFAMELPRTLKNDCGSPDGNMRTCSTQVDGASETVDITDMSLSIIPLVKEASEKNLPEVEAHLQGINLIEQKNESAQCDWESMISDSDLLIFNSPVHSEAFKGLIQKSLDTDAKFCVSHDDLIKMQDFDIMDMEDPSTQPNESIDPKEIINQTHQQLVACYGSETSIPTDQNEAGTSTAVTCKAISNIRRGMRRRCLDFEIVTTRNNSGCSALVESEEETASKGKQLVPVKPVNDSSKCIIRGIGLHLNSLAKTSKENQEAPASSVKNLICSTSSFHSPTTVQDLDEQLAMVSAETAGVPSIDDVLIAEDVTQASSYPVNEELDQGSPRKKRNKVDTEDGSCKRCNCKKSKCLKLYCECFAAGVYCIEPCSCQDCYNKPIHEDTVLATRKQIETRNPLAFAPKVIRSSEPIAETGDEFSKTPASARHKRGCNCKKSSCLKKYCECYQGGVGCSVSCRCEGCKNTFGRKDGSALPDTEAVPEAVPEDETEAAKSGADKVSQSTDNENNEEQNSAVPSTPLGLCRPLVRLPFSSKGKPPRSFLGIGLSSRLYPGKHNILQGQTKFVKPLQTIPSDDMPDVLHTKCSPSNGVKTSPNGKRVSPPQINAESSPARMSRKLILQSIPSFPSLTHQQ